MKDLNFPGKVRRIVRTPQGKVSSAAWGFSVVLLTPVMGSRDKAPKSLSYTALWQTQNSLCKDEKQALTIIKTLQ